MSLIHYLDQDGNDIYTMGYLHTGFTDKDDYPLYAQDTVLYNDSEYTIVLDNGRFRLDPDKYGQSLSDRDRITLVSRPSEKAGGSKGSE